MLSISPSIQIPETEFEFTYARSGGPGGQNVNKVNSKAILRWPVTSTPSLPSPVRDRFLSKYANRISLEGDLLLSSQKYRDQISNAEDCLEKLREMIVSVLNPPTPRRATRPTLASKKRRTESKQRDSIKKQRRSTPRTDD
ncbi:MAG: alternative ribosome rescue aminoacyl-tRNA hydrolase ArfB [Terriglobales bacterium]